jgi:hypothetical protein
MASSCTGTGKCDVVKVGPPVPIHFKFAVLSDPGF